MRSKRLPKKKRKLNFVEEVSLTECNVMLNTEVKPPEDFNTKYYDVLKDKHSINAQAPKKKSILGDPKSYNVYPSSLEIKSLDDIKLFIQTLQYLPKLVVATLQEGMLTYKDHQVIIDEFAKVLDKTNIVCLNLGEWSGDFTELFKTLRKSVVGHIYLTDEWFSSEVKKEVKGICSNNRKKDRYTCIMSGKSNILTNQKILEDGCKAWKNPWKQLLQNRAQKVK